MTLLPEYAFKLEHTMVSTRCSLAPRVWRAALRVWHSPYTNPLPTIHDNQLLSIPPFRFFGFPQHHPEVGART
jgi:hypothetical protein